ncbi:MAG: M4 family metallopeptidase [Bacteroidia bacterium]|nr:M4 family metallopeptidase [Bacteroidia bacterium]
MMQTQAQTALQRDNETIQAICSSVDPAGWLYIRDDISLAPENFWSQYQAAMGLGRQDEMLLKKSNRDELGYTYDRYQQYYATLIVEGAEYTLQSLDGKLKVAHGKLVEGLDLNPRASISEAEALQQALASISAEVYAWESEEWEKDRQIMTGDSLASWYPQGELLVGLVRGDKLVKDNYALTWVFEIKALAPDISVAVYVDAQSGEVLKTRSKVHNCNGVAGTFNPLYNTNLNPEPFAIRQRGWPYSDFVLEDCNKGQGIETRRTQFHTGGIFAGEPRTWNSTDRVINQTANWDNNRRIEASAQWALEETWDYFKNVYGQTGFDNLGARVNALVEYQGFQGVVFANAGYDSDNNMLVFGNNPNDNRSLVPLDIVGHEFTHGVTRYMSATPTNLGLVYEREPGALNESFSDIFGTLVERNVEGSGFNWTIGEDAWLLRNMQFPNTLLQPDRVGGNFWFDPSVAACPTPDDNNDDCGVHINSGVQNRWFVLLSQGGSQNGVTVSGIGIDKAALITWRNLVNQMQSQSNFNDARNGSILEATNLYGACSNEQAQVRNAWAAVNVGAASVLCANIVGPTAACTGDGMPLVFTAKTTAGATCTWSGIPASWPRTFSGPGNQTVTLTPGTTAITFNLTANVSLNGQTASDNHNFVLSACQPCQVCPQRLAAPSIRIYPQPASESFTVEVPEGELPAYIELLDLSGRRLLAYTATQSREQIKVNLPVGYYYLKLQGQTVTSSHPLQIVLP